MIDWTKSMTQFYEYYIVDPLSWKDREKITTVEKCKISRDLGAETLGSASFSITDFIGEYYIRCYMIAIQDKVEYKIPLGTFLVQTPTLESNSKRYTMNADGYTPLCELKENSPPIGYFVKKKSNILLSAYNATRGNVRAPVIKTNANDILNSDYVANPDENWLSYISNLLGNANHTLWIDELGRIGFNPIQSIDKLQPIWEYKNDNHSILQPEFSVSYDLYDIPNVVEVIYSNELGSNDIIIKNEDPNSPISIQNRGREIRHRVINPEVTGNQTDAFYRIYAENLLKEMSTIQHTITYTHGYCPARIGDCVLINNPHAKLHNVKARVMTQSIDCSTGCQVSETAVYTEKLWR